MKPLLLVGLLYGLNGCQTGETARLSELEAEVRDLQAGQVAHEEEIAALFSYLIDQDETGKQPVCYH